MKRQIVVLATLLSLEQLVQVEFQKTYQALSPEMKGLWLPALPSFEGYRVPQSDGNAHLFFLFSPQGEVKDTGILYAPSY